MHRIFLLPELLIHIISYLPCENLARCHQLSHHFHQTLRNNLPPCKHALPDPSPHRPDSKLLPQPLRSLASDIQKHSAPWMTPGMLLDISDDYYFWHDGAYSNLLHSLSPYLHPVLAHYATELMSGLKSLAEGEMGTVLRTKMGATVFYQLFCDDDEIAEGGSWKQEYLTKPSSKVVEIYCPLGATWDKGYANVLGRRGGREWQQRCVRVERERGVRMGDVVDEVRGVLKAEEDMEREGSEVVLEWRFGASAEMSVGMRRVGVDAFLDGSG